MWGTAGYRRPPLFFCLVMEWGGWGAPASSSRQFVTTMQRKRVELQHTWWSCDLAASIQQQESDAFCSMCLNSFYCCLPLTLFSSLMCSQAFKTLISQELLSLFGRPTFFLLFLFFFISLNSGTNNDKQQFKNKQKKPNLRISHVNFIGPGDLALP